jgi:hypothetical protein
MIARLLDYSTEIDESDIADEFTIDFNGHMLVKVVREKDGKYTAVNGVNGYGQNICDLVFGHEIAISEN